MKISELSKETGASVRSIRHYEKKKLITASRLENGYREFNGSAIERIRTIQLYLGLGLTADQIEEVLKCEEIYPEINEYCEGMLEIYEEKLGEINRQMNALATVQHRLEKQIDKIKDVILQRKDDKAAK
ncbi:MerR family transcriptional regulator [Rossellomorea sp. BNER]|uniref:MerR family transcriptional regulator n=1 Tax=Rossellomorea sp. BNER TaxID=2962031 RepID=UPI003AF216CC|nr:MerR family transcriptional regulator [Rossellomorea sp. BNER]